MLGRCAAHLLVGEPVRTARVEQCLRRGLAVPALMLVDKCAATFKALAQVAHAQIESEAARGDRAAAVAALPCGAAGSSLAGIAAARRLLTRLGKEAAQAAPLAAAADGGVPAAAVHAAAAAARPRRAPSRAHRPFR